MVTGVFAILSDFCSNSLLNFSGVSERRNLLTALSSVSLTFYIRQRDNRSPLLPRRQHRESIGQDVFHPGYAHFVLLHGSAA